MLRGAGRRAIVINCGIFTLLVVNRQTGEFRSLFEFFNYEQFMKDVAVITDTARSQTLIRTTRHGDHAKLQCRTRTAGFPISQIINLFKPSSTNSNSDRNDRMAQKTVDANDTCACSASSVVPGSL